jgi:hypothetical protein
VGRREIGDVGEGEGGDADVDDDHRERETAFGKLERIN